MSMATTVTTHGSSTSRFGELARDIKLSHTVFAMPFALLGAFLAAGHGGHLPGVGVLLLVVVCMIAGRTSAMAINRWADARIDAQNPRTSSRAVPSGRLTRRFMLGVAVFSGLALVIGAGGFWWFYSNPYPLMCAPVVLGWFVLYSYSKRFTWLCHMVLGVALGMSPLAAVLAVRPEYLGHLTPYLLAGMVLSWVAGFDVIYALQDRTADRSTGVYSIPAVWGSGAALWISRLLHMVSGSLLVGMWYSAPQLGGAFAVGTVLVCSLLILEHALVWGANTQRLQMAFFTVNGVISLLLGGLGVLDVIRSVI